MKECRFNSVFASLPGRGRGWQWCWIIFIALYCSLFAFGSSPITRAIGAAEQTIDRWERTKRNPYALGLTLVPGATANWTATSDPGQQGSAEDLGYTEQAIARWEEVPFQTYSTLTPIGIDAFHISGQENGDEGIAKVQFVANDGTPVDVTAPSKNPRTGRWGWWIYLSPLATDGYVEVRAVVYPHAGLPRLLQGNYITSVGTNITLPGNESSLVLKSNLNGTYNGGVAHVSNSGNDSTGTGALNAPFATIGRAILSLDDSASHGIIYLAAGTYQSYRATGNLFAYTGWLTICPEPGVDREDVIITGGNTSAYGTPTLMVRFRDITFDLSAGTGYSVVRGNSSNLKPNVWVEGCEIIGAGAETATFLASSGSDAGCFGSNSNGLQLLWHTESRDNRASHHDWQIGPNGYVVTGIDVYNLTGDAFSGSHLVRDFTVHTVTFLEGAHADLWQSQGVGSNRIIMDGRAWGAHLQMLFMDGGLSHNTGIAHVNIAVNYDPTGSTLVSSVAGRHVLFWNVVNDQTVLCRTNASATDGIDNSSYFGVRGCIFGGLSFLDTAGLGWTTANVEALDGWTWEDNHFISGSWTPGSGTGTGSAGFTDAENGNLFPSSVGTTTSTVRWDWQQKARASTTLRGAYADPTEYSEEDVPEIPDAPTGFSATADGEDRIDLAWTDASDDELGFLVDWSADETNWFPLVTCYEGVESYTHAGLAAGTQYFYRIRSFNSAGESSNATDDDTTDAGASMRVQVKTGATNSGTSLAVVLDAQPTQGNKLIAIVGTNGQIPSIADTAHLTWTKTASAGPNSTTLYYFVGTVVGASASATVTITFGSSACAAVIAEYASVGSVDQSNGNVSVSANTSATTGNTSTTTAVNELWVSGIVARGACVFSSPLNSSEIVAQVATTLATLGDRSTVLLERIVTATAAASTGATLSVSGQWAARIETFFAIAPVPADFAATPSGPTQIDLSWSDVSGETGYKIEGSANGVDGWSTLTTTAANATSYSHDGLDPGTAYFYRISSANSAGDSEYATANSVTSEEEPEAPADFSATANGTDTIDLAWTDNSDNETGFLIEVSADGMSGWSEVTTTAADAESYSHTGLDPDTQYFYRISAINGEGASEYDTANATTDPGEEEPEPSVGSVFRGRPLPGSLRFRRPLRYLGA